MAKDECGWVSLNIIGCIWYKSLGGSGLIYQTVVSYRIIENNGRKTDRITTGQNIPNSALEFVRNLFSNFDREVPETEVRRDA